MSNHVDALLVAYDQQQLSRFMQHFARLVGWKGPLWSRRYDGIVVSDEPDVQWARLRYVLGRERNGVCPAVSSWLYQRTKA